ncbi:hypothetical protein [Bdellovibrio bacteriovorus]|uniref:hypothetical protein n=1 Tax=Bdellovibrio TaxID=958 RepID=UPI000AF234B3|nr:hypothetical protein [Bdellovibrio bacteriovorus]
MKSIFLAAFTWLLVLDASAAIRQEVPIQSQRSLRQQVDSYAELLQKEVVKARNNKERFSSVHRVLGQIKTLRDNSAPQGALDEAHMDLMVSVLESLPQQKNFKRRDCYKYENDLVSQFEPTAEEAPIEPAVRPGWDVLQSLCR